MMKLTNDLKKIQPKDLFRLLFLSDAQLSPDSETVVYSVVSSDLEKNEEYSSLWLLSLQTGESNLLFNKKGNDVSPKWSPDGKKIAFISDCTGVPQLMVISVKDKIIQQLTFLERGVNGPPIWSPDGQMICFTSTRVKQVRDKSLPYRITRSTYRYDEVGLIDDEIQELFLISADGGEIRQLTDAPFQKRPLTWSPTGQEILFGAFWFPDSQNTFPHLWITDLNGEMRELVGGWGENMCACWTPDGEKVAFIAPRPDGPDGAKHELWVVNRDGSDLQSRTSGFDGWVGSRLYLDTVVWPSDKIFVSPDGGSVFTNVMIGGTVQIIKVSLQGDESWTRIITGERACYLQNGNGQNLLFIESTPDSPNELYIANLDGAEERRLTHLNDSTLAEFALAKVKHISFPAHDNETVEGWILYPPDCDGPYPTVLHNHGGPHCSWGARFVFEFQMLAAAGYAVLALNYRGSVGYGDEFSTPLVGNMGDPPYRDLMSGVDYAIEQGIADPDRLGCCGQSAGAFLTCWIVGHTNRFKAAVAESTYVDYMLQFGTSHAPGLAVVEMGGYPYEIPDVYRRCSPITYAHQCITPTLLIVNDEDYNCPSNQAELFYAVLKSTGCNTEMLRLPDSSHDGASSGPLTGRHAQNVALLDWMDRFLTKE